MLLDHSNFSVYKPLEAAKLIGISSQRIKRWISGYNYKSDGKIKTQPPLWNRKYSEFEDCYLGFQDLIEIRFVEAFVRAGLSPHAVRKLLNKARDIVDSEYPLSTHQFKTDGKTIFLEVWETDDAKAIDVRSGQHAFHSIIRPSFRDLEFNENTVTKWYVAGRNKKLEIDPDKAFGQPVIENTSIPTARLFEAFQAEGNAKSVARQFEISLAAVRHAIEFETKMASHH